MLTRYYEPTMGRFDTRDVLFGDHADPTSLNQAVYAEDAPVTFTDPTGMKVELGEVGTAGSCSRACQASLAEASAEFIATHPDIFGRPSVDAPTMPQIGPLPKPQASGGRKDLQLGESPQLPQPTASPQQAPRTPSPSSIECVTIATLGGIALLVTSVLPFFVPIPVGILVVATTVGVVSTLAGIKTGCI
jgi:hypothetical protein